MTDNLIPISLIGNYLYCPYSIYLHNVYMEADDSVYKAEHLYKGTAVHNTIDDKRQNNRKEVLLALPVLSEKYGIVGKIDMYNTKTKELVERKTKVDKIYPRHIYQLWAQYFCLLEMGYEVEKLSLYDYTNNKKHYIDLPEEQGAKEFEDFVKSMRAYNPYTDEVEIVEQKCRYCIFTNLCEKSPVDNVYT